MEHLSKMHIYETMHYMTLMQKMITWQQEKARKEHLEPYMVLQFNTIKEIIRLQPKTHNDLIKIKGIGPAKIRKYGDEIIAIVRGNGIVEESVQIDNGNSLFADADIVNDAVLTSVDPQHEKLHYDSDTGEIIDDVQSAVSVTEFVTMLDTMLRTNFYSMRVQGEVVGFKHNTNGHAYFEIKDKDSVLRCAVFRSSYDLSGIQLEDGMEIVITGQPNYHKKYGFSFIGETVELFGEGALKKAYDDLKKKLDQEGLFAQERKRTVPQFPEKIGLITSRTGAAIGDFTSNVGQYGYKILFHHTSVEGAHALGEIKKALEIMAKKDLDVLVIVRGGGSLESLQAFNNEKIVRMIADFSVPVIAGIGHEQDETIATLIADVGASTPTAAARAVRESWDDGEKYVRDRENVIVHKFEKILHTKKEELDGSERIMTRQLENIIAYFNDVFHRFSLTTQRIEGSIKEQKNILIDCTKRMYAEYEKSVQHVDMLLDASLFLRIYHASVAQCNKKMQFLEKSIEYHDPQRQLSRGYSIATDEDGKIIRSVDQITKGATMHVQVIDGTIKTKVLK